MPAEERSVSIPVLLLVALGGVIVLLAVVLLFTRHRPAPTPSTALVLSGEEKAYLQQMTVTDARMSAAENFLGHTVFFLDARVTNRGRRVVRRLELELKFVDTLNQVVLREKAWPITERTPPLQPGEIRAFQVSFDHLPADWNQAPPTITPVQVRF